MYKTFITEMHHLQNTSNETKKLKRHNLFTLLLNVQPFFCRIVVLDVNDFHQVLSSYSMSSEIRIV